MEDLSIREILEQIGRGQIRIPAFQRKFVWEPERVAYLMDSIYKRYPFGSLLFWRTKEILKFDRDLGPFTLPAPQVDYPVDYVLDGQQRITSIFGVFQTELSFSDNAAWLPIYLDLQAEESAQESQFVALKVDQVDLDRHFPLNTLFDTTAYRRATKAFDDATTERIDRVQEVFKETSIPVQTSKTEDKATVAIIFERVNRQGIELDTLQLLSAWTWSEEFQLQDQFSDLTEELKPFGFADVGADTNLLLRTCAAVLTADASPQALMSLKGSLVRERFDEVTNGVKYAVEFLRQEFRAENIDNLPMTTLIIPLAVFFSVTGNKEASITDDQRRRICRWFWRASFSRRYSAAVLRNLNADIAQMRLLKAGKDSSLGSFSAGLSGDFFLFNTFNLSTVNTKTFVLMLASENPRSFISGVQIDLRKTLKQANRTEFHHLTPKNFLKGTESQGIDDSCLANFAFMSRSDNRKLGGVAPSTYRKKMPPEIAQILQSALCPESLFSDNYSQFISDRAATLRLKARALCEVGAEFADTDDDDDDFSDVTLDFDDGVLEETILGHPAEAGDDG